MDYSPKYITYKKSTPTLLEDESALCLFTFVYLFTYFVYLLAGVRMMAASFKRYSTACKQHHKRHNHANHTATSHRQIRSHLLGGRLSGSLLLFSSLLLCSSVAIRSTCVGTSVGGISVCTNVSSASKCAESRTST